MKEFKVLRVNMSEKVLSDLVLGSLAASIRNLCGPWHLLCVVFPAQNRNCDVNVK